MGEFWLGNQFEELITEDGSPTLRALKSSNLETMHHRGGAFSETQLIYGEALREVLSKQGRSIMSLGLGLGYNEFLLACEALRFGLKPEEIYIESFESEEVLSREFVKFVSGSESAQTIYLKILQLYCHHYGVESGSVLKWLKKAIENRYLQIRPCLNTSVQFSKKFDLIFYDAFSSKTSPELWQEEFLDQLWSKIASSNCLLSTYACTGALKRSLKKNGFQLSLVPGFQSKRERTVARKISPSF